MTEPMTVALDVDYVREVGEEVRARLFPVPKADGRQPYPNPVKVHFQPAPEIDVEVRFVMERTFQALGEFGQDAPPAALAFVLHGATDAVLVDLSFGKEPTVPRLVEVEEGEQEAFHALLRAVAGLL